MTTLSTALDSTAPAAGTLVAADGSTIPLTATRLVVRADSGFARVRLLQTFRNVHTTPLHVTYRLPLPADAAVGGFAFQIGDATVRGEIDSRRRARERFEEAIASGRTASLLEQDRSSLFTQELGNVPPGASIEAEIEIDQPLAWDGDGWTWRFPTTVAPRYLGGAGRVPDANRIDVDVVDPSGPTLPPRCELELAVADPVVGTIASTSHALRVTAANGASAVTFASENGRVAMDRDVVVHWRVAAPGVGVSLRTTRVGDGPLAGRAFGLLTIVPPRADIAMRARPRDVIVLLDISGSMHGAPLAQAQQVTSALLGSLGRDDRFELIAFASEAASWSEGSMPATAANIAAALQWVRALRAGGSTEMHGAILEALASLRSDAQRQVVVVTDGQIGFEREIVGTIRNSLPASSRVHVVGVGSAPNRSLTQAASRAGRGLEVLIGIGEDPAPAAAKLLTRTALPLVDALEVHGTAIVARAPLALPDLFGGAPVRILLELAPAGGTVQVHGVTANGAFEHTLAIATPEVATPDDLVLARAFARERVEDLETELAATGEHERIDALVESIGLSFRIATRTTSWIAVTAEATVDPRAPQRREVVPHELPHGMSIAMLGLRGAGAQSMPGLGAAADMCSLAAPAPIQAERSRAKRAQFAEPRETAPEGAVPPPPPKAPKAKKASFLSRLLGRGGAAPVAVLRSSTADRLVFELRGLAEWRTPERVTVVFADGREIDLAIDAALSTNDGALPHGTLARLVLQHGGNLPSTPIATLRLWRGSEALDVAVVTA